MHKLRVYIDTSVFGGVFDEEFKTGSQLFFNQLKQGLFIPVISPAIEKEISLAPSFVAALIDDIRDKLEIIEENMESLALQHKYLQANIVSERYRTDALHVAIASVNNCSAIVSWNFKHLVNYDKISQYNAINMLNGYKMIQIHTPLEMIHYEEEN
jgi:predicted nucleic acid-binding protein